MRVTVLGCGYSLGVPTIGCDCKTCLSDNPKNKRSRVSALIDVHGKNILIDTSPDLRQQALQNNIRRVDAVLYTHDHADHTHGIDDLRSFNYLSGDVLPVYGDKKTLESLQKRFAYTFLGKPEHWYRPALQPNILPDDDVFEFSGLGIPITGFKQTHGKTTTLGYRIGKFAYSVDVDHLPEAAFKALAGVEYWLVDCLRYTESRSHSNLESTIKWVGRVKPKLAVLTHMAHEFEYEKLSKELPAGIVPGYDGMVLEVL